MNNVKIGDRVMIARDLSLWDATEGSIRSSDLAVKAGTTARVVWVGFSTFEVQPEDVSQVAEEIETSRYFTGRPTRDFFVEDHDYVVLTNKLYIFYDIVDLESETNIVIATSVEEAKRLVIEGLINKRIRGPEDDDEGKWDEMDPTDIVLPEPEVYDINHGLVIGYNPYLS